MALRDLKNNLVASRSLDPAARTADANGAGVDTRDADSVAFLLLVGAVPDGTHSFVPQESDDDSTYTDIAAADLEGTLPTISGDSPDTGVSAVTLIGYKGDKRYVRVRSEHLGGSPPSGTANLAGAVILGHLHGQPQ